MITNKLKLSKENKIIKSPLLAKIKFEPTFFPVLWRFAFPLPLFGEAGGRGVRGGIPPAEPSQRASQQPLFLTGGEWRIRTSGTEISAQRFSRPPHSTTLATLQFLLTTFYFFYPNNAINLVFYIQYLFWRRREDSNP